MVRNDVDDVDTDDVDFSDEDDFPSIATVPAKSNSSGLLPYVKYIPLGVESSDPSSPSKLQQYLDHKVNKIIDFLVLGESQFSNTEMSKQLRTSLIPALHMFMDTTPANDNFHIEKLYELINQLIVFSGDYTFSFFVESIPKQHDLIIKKLSQLLADHKADNLEELSCINDKTTVDMIVEGICALRNLYLKNTDEFRLVMMRVIREGLAGTMWKHPNGSFKDVKFVTNYVVVSVGRATAGGSRSGRSSDQAFRDVNAMNRLNERFIPRAM
jgi:hypothetical protein